MCLQCWDADKMSDKLKNVSNTTEVCDGMDMLTMSLEELKDELLEEWLSTDKTNYRIFKKAVPEYKKDSLTWQLTSPTNSEKKADIHVSFV